MRHSRLRGCPGCVAEVDPAGGQPIRRLTPETALLRDLPFTLQGLSSATLPFSKETALKLPPTLPSPMISLLHTLAEPSLLYRGLGNFVGVHRTRMGC